MPGLPHGLPGYLALALQLWLWTLDACPGYFFATLHLESRSLPKKSVFKLTPLALLPLIRSPSESLRLFISFGCISMTHMLIKWVYDSTQQPIAHSPALIRNSCIENIPMWSVCRLAAHNT